MRVRPCRSGAARRLTELRAAPGPVGSGWPRRRDVDQRRSRDRAAHGALMRMGIDPGPLHGAQERLRVVRALAFGPNRRNHQR